MQLTLVLNQTRMLEWDLNLIQATVFMVVHQAPSWAEPHPTEPGYYWLNSSKVHEELPALRVHKDTVRKTLAVLKSKGLFDGMVDQKQNRNYIRLSQKGKLWNRADPALAAKLTDQRGGDKSAAPPEQAVDNFASQNAAAQKVAQNEPKTAERGGFISRGGPDKSAGNQLTNINKENDRADLSAAPPEQPVDNFAMYKPRPWPHGQPQTTEAWRKYLNQRHWIVEQAIRPTDEPILMAWVQSKITEAELDEAVAYIRQFVFKSQNIPLRLIAERLQSEPPQAEEAKSA